MKISVIIPTFHRPEALLRCLDSCLLQACGGDSPAENFSLEILVVSNGNDPLLRRWLDPYLAQYPNLHYLEALGRGVNRARNLGVAKASGDIFYFVDDDCILPSADHLAKVMARHREYPHFSGIGGYYLSPAANCILSRYYNRMSNAWLDLYREQDHSQRLLGGNTSFRKNVFSGGARFRDEIQYGGSESEFQIRLLAEGHLFQVFSDLSVWHDLRSTWAGLIRKAWRQSVERARRAPSTIEAAYFRRLARIRKFSPLRVAKLVPLLPYFMIGQAAYVTTRLNSRSFARKHG